MPTPAIIHFTVRCMEKKPPWSAATDGLLASGFLAAQRLAKASLAAETAFGHWGLVARIPSP